MQEEFSRQELGVATTTLDAGKWAGLDYLVNLTNVNGKDGEIMLEATMIDIDSGETFSAIVGQRGNNISNLAMTQRLYHNLVEVYSAGSQDERAALYEIQRAEAAVDGASLDRKIMLTTVAACYTGGFLIGTAKGGFGGIFFGTLISGGLAGVSWWGYKSYVKLYNDSRDHLKKLVGDYNATYNKHKVVIY